jgi:hypothetical protein
MMTDTKIVQAVKQQLFSGKSEHNVFAILDGASVPNLQAKLSEIGPEHVCLYRGEVAPDMAEVAPYLVMLERNARFTDWVIGSGWGEHWGIFGAGPVDLATLRRHFRKFLTVYDYAGRSLYFRYYDPRVLQIYLPTCNQLELEFLFGPVSFYLAEKDNSNCAIRFAVVDKILFQNEVIAINVISSK